MREYTGIDADSQSGKEVRAGKPEWGDGEAARSILDSSNLNAQTSGTSSPTSAVLKPVPDNDLRHGDEFSQNPDSGGVPFTEYTVDSVVFGDVLDSNPRDRMYPVEHYRLDSKVVCQGIKGRTRNKQGVRGQVDGMQASWKSLRDLAFFAGNCTPALRTMLTLTFHPHVEEQLSADEIMEALHRFLSDVLARKYKWKLYLWIREHQVSQVVHFHIFIPDEIEGTDVVEAGDNPVNLKLSKELSQHWCRLLVSRLEKGETLIKPCFVCQSGDYRSCVGCHYGPALAKMVNQREMVNQYPGFAGCVRAEPLLRHESAASYVAKEASKRFQKQAPEKWWAHHWSHRSRKFKLEPLSHSYESGWDLSWCSYTKEDGFVVDQPHRIQNQFQKEIHKRRMQDESDPSRFGR